MNIIQLADGSFRVDYRDGFGKRHRANLGNVRRIAERKMQAIDEQVQRQKLGLSPQMERCKLTLTELLEQWIAQNPRENRGSTLKRKRSVLNNIKNYLGQRPIVTLQSSDFENYLDSRKNKGVAQKKGVSISTRNREIAILKACLAYAVSRKYLVYSPTAALKVQSEKHLRRTRVLGLEEEKLLLEKANPYMAEIIRFAIATGMRKCEILSLRWDRVDMNKRTAFIPAELSKSKKCRTVPLVGQAWEVIQRQFEKLQEPVSMTNTGEIKTKVKPGALQLPVFCYKNRTEWRFREKTFKDICECANISGLWFHDLRRTCATRLLAAGADFKTVSEWIGDEPKTTVEVYCQTSPERLREMGEKMAKMFI